MKICGESFEDLVGGFGPGEWLRIVVPVGDPVADVLFQRVDRCVHAAAQLFVGQQREPPLDLVEPRRVGGREVHVKSGTGGQPLAIGGDLWVA